MLKAWKSPEAPVFQVIVAEEDVCEDDQPGQGGEELAQKQAQELQAVLKQIGDVICETTGKAHDTDHGIDIGGHTPIRSVPYRLAPAWKEQLHVEVLSLLEQGIARPSLSPWSSPMVPVRKPDGSVRLCIDFRKVNSITTPDPYAMLLINDLIDQLGEAKILSKIDLNKGFYQILLKEADLPKTAFCTSWGKFQFTRCPLVSATPRQPFKCLMHVVLAGFESFCNSYMDDIIIFSNSWEEHLEHIQLVVEKLRQAGLTAKPSKCCWGVASLSYLGHVVGNGESVST